MKFIVSLFALALFFVFALADAAKGITYAPEAAPVATQTNPAPEKALTLAQTTSQEKAGFSF
jgi:hypothetical protein